MVNILLVLAGEITFGETQVVDRIKQIGLADAIAAGNPNDPLGKGEIRVKVVFKLKE